MGGDLTDLEYRFSMNNPFSDDIGGSIMGTRWLKGKWAAEFVRKPLLKPEGTGVAFRSSAELCSLGHPDSNQPGTIGRRHFKVI